MPTMPPPSRYSVTIFAPDGERQRLGRYRVSIEGETVSARRRSGQPVAELLAVSSEHTNNRWTLTAGDGSWWELASCGCGG